MRVENQHFAGASELQKIAEGIQLALGVPAAFLDSGGEVLAAAPHWDICSEFPFPRSRPGNRGKNSGRRELSSVELSNLPEDCSCFELSCPQGCTALIMPLVFGGSEIGTFFLGCYRYADIPEGCSEWRTDACDDCCICSEKRDKFPSLSYRRVLESMNMACIHVFAQARIADPGLGQISLKKRADIHPGPFQELFDHVPAPLYVFDVFENVIEVNRAACEKFGLPRHDLLEYRLEKLLPAEEIENARERLAEAVRYGSTVFEARCVEGAVIEVSCRSFKYGEKNAIIACVKDIEARKKSDDALSKSEERFRSVFEQSNVSMSLVSPEGKFLQVNQRFCDFLGYEEEEILGFYAWDVSFPEDRAEVRIYFENYFAGEVQNFTLERRYCRKDGTMSWGSVSASLVRGPAGEPLYSIGIIEDITRQKTAEDAMHRALVETEAARERTDAIVASIKDGLIATDMEDRIILMNGAAEGILGIGFEAAANKSLERLIDSIVPAKKPAPYHELRTREFVLENIAMDSAIHRPRAVHFKISPIITRDGEKVGRIAVLRDITREREIDRMKNEFISTAAHELRTPLTSIKGFSQILLAKNNLTDEQKREFIFYIHQNSEALEKIINDLFALCRVDSDRIIHLKKSEGHICSDIENVVSGYRREHSSYRFITDLSSGIPPLWFDHEKILQVMENLLSNAVKFSPQNRDIRIRCMKKGQEVIISVSDEGIGMAPQEIERIFDKFYRIDSSDTAVAGLGLGMAIVKNIIEAHLGRIWVESQLGCGTTVSFALPLPHCLQKS